MVGVDREEGGDRRERQHQGRDRPADGGRPATGHHRALLDRGQGEEGGLEWAYEVVSGDPLGYLSVLSTVPGPAGAGVAPPAAGGF